jgi:hypothetical protein
MGKWFSKPCRQCPQVPNCPECPKGPNCPECPPKTDCPERPTEMIINTDKSERKDPGKCNAELRNRTIHHKGGNSRDWNTIFKSGGQEACAELTYPHPCLDISVVAADPVDGSHGRAIYVCPSRN